ncbi:MAG: biopolymer transporter ExbD [Lysobacterales bacterium]
MGMGAGHEPGGVMAEINVTPMVDVMLVLLIIFMITAPLMSHKVEVKLPQAQMEPNKEPPSTITLTMETDGDVFWNDSPTVLESIDNQLRIEAKRTPQPDVQIRADRDTPYGEVAKLMISAKNAGMKKVGFITSPKRAG